MRLPFVHELVTPLTSEMHTEALSGPHSSYCYIIAITVYAYSSESFVPLLRHTSLILFWSSLQQELKLYWFRKDALAIFYFLSDRYESNHFDVYFMFTWRFIAQTGRVAALVSCFFDIYPPTDNKNTAFVFFVSPRHCDLFIDYLHIILYVFWNTTTPRTRKQRSCKTAKVLCK